MQGGHMPLNLNDAQIDLNGVIICDGCIDFPDDPEGLFEKPAHNQIGIRWHADFAHIIALQATRDPECGFYQSTYLNLMVSLPGGMLQFLKRRTTLSLRADSFLQSPGILKTNHEPLAQCTQQNLSNWQLNMHVEGDFVRCRVSADLIDQGPSYFKKNHWPSTEQPARVDINFKIHKASQWLAFGTPSGPTEKDIPHIKPKKVLSSNKPQLGTIQITPVGDLIAYPTDGGFARIEGQFPHSIALYDELEPGPGTSYFFQNGVLPNITLYALDFRQRLRALRTKNPVRLTMKGDMIGELWGNTADMRAAYESREGLDNSLTYVEMNLCLDHEGLNISYSAHSTGYERVRKSEASLSHSITLPWPALIVRYPELASEREKYPN